MSAANVQFLTLDHQPCPAGQKPARFTFRCPVFNRGRPAGMDEEECGHLLLIPGPHTEHHGIKHDPNGQNGGVAQWIWDGNTASPTFTPSINCGGCMWHGYIRAGRCVEVNGSDSP
jgi:hypothetical protein